MPTCGLHSPSRVRGPAIYHALLESFPRFAASIPNIGIVDESSPNQVPEAGNREIGDDSPPIRATSLFSNQDRREPRPSSSLDIAFDAISYDHKPVAFMQESASRLEHRRFGFADHLRGGSSGGFDRCKDRSRGGSRSVGLRECRVPARRIKPRPRPDEARSSTKLAVVETFVATHHDDLSLSSV